MSDRVQAPDAAQSRILIVDDEPANVLILERVLARGGYAHVRSTTDSGTVLAQLEEWLPDLVLLDLMMPAPDGFGILKHVTTMPAAMRMPVLVLTASGMPEDRQRALGLGASDFVTKPFDQGEVLLRIANLLGTRRLQIALRHQNEDLEAEITRRTHALTDSLAELRRAMCEREELVSRLVSAQEEERRRIAADIHDDTMQAMVAAALSIERLGRDATDTSLAMEFQTLQESVRDAIGRLRNLLFDVHPAMLERDGLAASLRVYLERMQAAGGPGFSLEVAGDPDPTPEARATLYRIAQEALTNAKKHAQARRLEVRLWSDAVGIGLRITDDGIGFAHDPHAHPEDGHLGMTTMHERAAVVGGTLRVQSHPGGGTTVEVLLPSARRDAATDASKELVA